MIYCEKEERKIVIIVLLRNIVKCLGDRYINQKDVQLSRFLISHVHTKRRTQQHKLRAHNGNIAYRC